MPNSILLTASQGFLWDRKPTPNYDGLILVAYNCVHPGSRKFVPQLNAPEDPTRKLVPFCCLSFDVTGEALAAVDTRGHLFIIRVLKNEYEVVKRFGTAASAIQFSPTRKSELLVALHDHSIISLNIGTNQRLETQNKQCIH